MTKPNLTIEQLQSICPKIESITCFNSILIVNDDSAQVERLVWFLKTLNEFEAHHLLAVNDHKGGMTFLWNSFVPPRFRDLADIEVPDGDVWTIYNNYVMDYKGQIAQEA
jgi:hypothetical protein